jgi:hypothetical protein
MGRKISATDFPPSAELRVEGAELKGVYQGNREIKTQYGLKKVFMFKVLSANCNFLKNKVEYEPAANELVEVMGTTTLTNQLNQVKEGETVTIKYAGLGKKTKGNAPHLFDVEVD